MKAAWSMVGACVIGAACAVMAGSGVRVEPRSARLPPPNTRLVVGVLDPVHWRALPPADRPFAEWEKWAINRARAGALLADVSAVATQANQYANQRVRAYGRIRTAVGHDGSTVRYLRVLLIEPVE